MKKPLSLALAAIFSLSAAGVSLAAPANPFTDVPANHWAYDAVSELQQNGVISGYGDGTFRGDRTLTRYELAAIVAKIDSAAGKDNPMVKKLQEEFAAELYNLGVRIDALEKNASSIKFSGDGRIRYIGNMAIDGENAAFRGDGKTPSKFENRIQLHLESEVNDHITFYGRLVAENENGARGTDGQRTSSTAEFEFDRAEFQWQNANTTVSVGRLVPTLGQGLIWDDSAADGFLVTQGIGRFDVSAGYLDIGNTVGLDNSASLGAFAANIGAKVTDKVNLTAAYLKVNNSMNGAGPDGVDLGDNVGYDFEQMAFGFDAGLGKDFLVKGEYVKNRAADNDNTGYWGRLQWKEADPAEPGTYAVYVDYMKLGGWAIDSDTFGHILNVAGGNGIGGDGAKGYGLGVQYVWAKNADLELNFYDLKTHNGNRKYKKSYNVVSNFYF
jgi:hypothetical protein